MKLKSLHIKGFKSFANETTIHFNDEIIGIVGPNGSGKSNIVDAIRWVLGEQKSRELRLDKMVDVIFNGTKSKKKSGMAQVSMTFENSKKLIPVEFDTVRISRILYDTNESEYRINDVPCRLKDIRDLFLDTGIGSNSYAIIELGMVDDILVDKDHSRRRMFEQAAGIAKYKVRKREALLKLKNTQNDLDRVDDILFELESNLKSLERQARRTKKYYELKDEYKTLAIQKTIISQQEALNEEKKLKELLLNEREKLTAAAQEIHSLEAEIEKTKKSNLDSEQMLSSKQKEFSALVEDIRSKESSKEIKIQNSQFLRQNIAREERNISGFKDDLRLNDAILKEKKQEFDRLSGISPQLEGNYLDWKAKYEAIEAQRNALQGVNSEHASQLKALENERFNLEKKKIELNSKIDYSNQNKSNIREQLESYSDTRNSLIQEKQSLLEEADKIEAAHKALLSRKADFDREKAALQETIEKEKSQLALINRKLDALSNEHNLLKDMVDSLEGFPESAKFLVREWKQAKPLLGDILECPPEYRNAIESFLDPYLSYFILDSVDEARKSIDLLQQAQKGKSQFFILSSFEEKQSRTQVLYDHLGVPALEVVKTDTKYAPLVNYLLNNVIILNDEEVLTTELKDEELIYLARNGTTNRTKHMITGGSISLFDGKKIGRKKEIEKLRKNIEETEKELGKTESRIASNQLKFENLLAQNLKTELEKLIQRKNMNEIARAQLETKLNNAEEVIASANNRMASFDSGVAELQNEIESISTQLQTTEKLLDQQREEFEQQSGQIEDISRNFSEINASFNHAQLEWVKHQNELTNAENELTFRQKQLDEINQKITHSQNELENYTAQLERNKEVITNLENELVGVYKIREQKQEELNETEQAFFSNRNVVYKREEILKQKNREYQNLQSAINDLKDKLTGIEFELRSAVERLKIEFNIELKTLNIAEYAVEADEVEELTLRYEKIKRRLENYGEINPMAVEAYDEMMVRFESMNTQKEDILKAKVSLEETIGEIDKDATQKFIDSFEKVKENFKEVFRSLFSSEDDCDLILFNPENPLESDIEIVAKPKGKRPKVLSQLSGGEKTLTATALLFSLYLLKPAPFCIFDEVDAPLDDINIQKFSRLIRKFSDESQFIIITHNKSTMAAMDTLYGVYMQEQGVSGVTQVDFREYEHDELFKTVNLQ